MEEAQRALRTDTLTFYFPWNYVGLAVDFTSLLTTNISRHLGLGPGDKVEVEYNEGSVTLRPIQGELIGRWSKNEVHVYRRT